MTAERWANDRFGRYFLGSLLVGASSILASLGNSIFRFGIGLSVACILVIYIGHEIDEFRRARKFEDLSHGFQQFREYAGSRLRRNGNLLEDIDRGTKAILTGQTEAALRLNGLGIQEGIATSRTRTTGPLTTREEDSEAARGSYPHDLERRWENAVRAYHRNKLGPNDVEVGNQANSYPSTASGLLGHQTNVNSGLASWNGIVSMAESASQVGNDESMEGYSQTYIPDLQSVQSYGSVTTKLEAYDEVGPTSLHPF